MSHRKRSCIDSRTPVFYTTRLYAYGILPLHYEMPSEAFIFRVSFCLTVQ